jgi:hypothetical protein
MSSLLILLLALCVALGGCSVQIVSCPGLGCGPSFVLTGWLPSNTTTSVSLNRGQILLDQLQRPWQLTAEVSVQLSASAHQLAYTWGPSGQTLQNAYEVMRPQGALESCPVAAQCCVDAQGAYQVRSLARNATIYTVDQVVWLDQVESPFIPIMVRIHASRSFRTGFPKLFGHG